MAASPWLYPHRCIPVAVVEPAFALWPIASSSLIVIPMRMRILSVSMCPSLGWIPCISFLHISDHVTLLHPQRCLLHRPPHHDSQFCPGPAGTGGSRPAHRSHPAYTCQSEHLTLALPVTLALILALALTLALTVAVAVTLALIMN